MSCKMVNNIIFVILVVGGTFLGLQVSNLTGQISSLRADYLGLLNQYNTLQENYAKVHEEYRGSLIEYSNLLSNYNTLQTNITSLNSSYDNLKSKYDSLSEDYYKLQVNSASLKSENTILANKNQDLQKLIDSYENVPNSYYSVSSFKQYSNTWNDLSRFLNSEFKMPAEYEENVFDCSESAAYLEWALENAGFNAEIFVGPTPSGANTYHAWVMVYTTDYRVAIESTSLTSSQRSAALSWGRVPGVIYGNDSLIKYWENYYNNYNQKFKNIYIAIRDSGKSGSEWDWWLGAFGFK